MPADLKTLFASLNAALKERVDAASDDEAKKEARAGFVEELKDGVPEIYNGIHTAAFTAARVQGDKAKAGVAKKVTDLEAEVTDLKTQLAEAQTGKPDVVAIEAKWAAKLEKKDKELEKERGERKTEGRTRVMADAVSALESALSSGDEALRPKAAKYEVARLVAEGFISLTDDGALEFRQLDDKDTAYPPPKNGARVPDALIKAIKKTADPVDRVSNVDRGAGIGAGGRSGVAGAGNANVRAGGPAMPNGVPLPANVSAEAVQRKLAERAGAGI